MNDHTSLDTEHLAGNVGGALRVGGTVHRATGPWTPAVHALLGHLAGRIDHIPNVLGFDDEGREVLTYLPGHVVDIDSDCLSTGQIRSLVTWTRQFHEAVADFDHPGPWRYAGMPEPTLIGHNDIAPYNACFDGDEVVGVFDGDLAGPSAREILHAVPRRIDAMLEWIPAAAAAGDRGMRNLMRQGEPRRSRGALEALRTRIPDIAALLG